ncbi:fmr1 neighbor protein-like [Pantherophis guttatus]|uniref:Fmr1 neighbor protein-like n=1 Tax=Pantherophis guttatus TaxID=94885 RepID=A0A6P9DTQ8_PANGU|nr:FMR1 neighbor protein [Pantherophis guttatus]XP_060538800.1 fmr1 neighbor protein-like [Pantherophis guttatus]
MIPIMRLVLQLLAKYLCVLFHAVNPSFSLPALEVQNESYIVPTEPRIKAEIISQKVENFFNPLTCWPRGNQKAVACRAGDHINQTLCLENKCCVSSRKFIQLDCYTPFEDRPQQILRIFGVGIAGMLAIVCLPFCCFVVERSPCANPLRRAPKEDDTEEGSEDSDESSSS